MKILRVFLKLDNILIPTECGIFVLNLKIFFNSEMSVIWKNICIFLKNPVVSHTNPVYPPMWQHLSDAFNIMIIFIVIIIVVIIILLSVVVVSQLLKRNKNKKRHRKMEKKHKTCSSCYLLSGECLWNIFGRIEHTSCSQDMSPYIHTYKSMYTFFVLLMAVHTCFLFCFSPLVQGSLFLMAFRAQKVSFQHTHIYMSVCMHAFT